jgi:hypothetical protein
VSVASSMPCVGVCVCVCMLCVVCVCVCVCYALCVCVCVCVPPFLSQFRPRIEQQRTCTCTHCRSPDYFFTRSLTTQRGCDCWRHFSDRRDCTHASGMRGGRRALRLRPVEAASRRSRAHQATNVHRAYSRGESQTHAVQRLQRPPFGTLPTLTSSHTASSGSHHPALCFHARS